MDDLNEEVGVGELNATVEEINTRNEIPKELKWRRGPTIMFDVTRIRGLGDKKVVRYNEDGASIGENGAKFVFHRVCNPLSCLYHIYILEKCACRTER